MISTQIKIEINGKERLIDFEQIPVLSPETVSTANKIKNIEFPSCFQLVHSLHLQAASIQEVQNSLKTTQDQEHREKLIALLKTALLVVLVAGCVASCVFGGAAVMVAGLVIGLLGYTLLAHSFYQQANEEIEKIEEQFPNYTRPWYFPVRTQDKEMQLGVLLALSGGGFVMPLFEAFTRKSRLERLLESKKTQLEETLSEHKKQLPNAHSLAQTELPQIIQGLDTEIKKCAASLTGLKELKQRQAIGEAQLQSQISQYEKAKKELQKIVDFYPIEPQ